tara:strand:+ start:3686 stop:3859 length:174 start_codon:yes stop_codon:yes gene_type:complete
MIAVVEFLEVHPFAFEFKESELVLKVSDPIAKISLVNLTETIGLKVGEKVRDVAFDF